mgnify:CR=1 FL=1
MYVPFSFVPAKCELHTFADHASQGGYGACSYVCGIPIIIIMADFIKNGSGAWYTVLENSAFMFHEIEADITALLTRSNIRCETIY